VLSGSSKNRKDHDFTLSSIPAEECSLCYGHEMVFLVDIRQEKPRQPQRRLMAGLWQEACFDATAPVVARPAEVGVQRADCPVDFQPLHLKLRRRVFQIQR